MGGKKKTKGEQVVAAEVAEEGAEAGEEQPVQAEEPPKKLKKTGKDKDVKDAKEKKPPRKKKEKTAAAADEKEDKGEVTAISGEGDLQSESSGSKPTPPAIADGGEPAAESEQKQDEEMKDGEAEPAAEKKDQEEEKAGDPAAEESEEAEGEAEDEPDLQAEEEETPTAGNTKSAAGGAAAAQQQSTGVKKKKEAEKKKPFTDKEAEQAIAEFMERNNRPYNYQNLLDNFQHQLKKPQCMRILEELTENKILTLKEYGKAKVYLVNQELFQETNAEELALLDEQIAVRKSEYDDLTGKVKKSGQNLKENAAGMTNSMYKDKIEETRKTIEKLKEQIEPYKSGGRKMMTEAEIEKIDAKSKKLNNEWKRKRKGCMDVIDIISESCEMNRKDFAKKVGIDTDEQANVKCPV